MQENQKLENVLSATQRVKWIFACCVGGVVFGTTIIYPLLSLSGILPVSAASWGAGIVIATILTMVLTRWQARARQR